MLRDTSRLYVLASFAREVDALVRFALAAHEFAVTTTARQLAWGELTMRVLIDGGSMDVRDRIHTLAVYALLFVSLSRKRVQQMLDRAADMTETGGGRPRSYSVA
ncbi:hypothetical protein ACWD3J_36705 [Streptomyces sp. NPDC002755]|uniref:hypothetical protein n=1 Tax=Streptomyces sp. NPDC002884 TaxID=3154544 RepID=UPI003330F993